MSARSCVPSGIKRKSSVKLSSELNYALIRFAIRNTRRIRFKCEKKVGTKATTYTVYCKGLYIAELVTQGYHCEGVACSTEISFDGATNHEFA